MRLVAELFFLPMAIHHFALFALATFLLNMTPGNDFIYVVTRSLSQGVRAGIISAFGISLGLVIHITASVLGLSVILAKSILVFNLIKYAGAAYLIYLGVKMLFAKSYNLDSVSLSGAKNIPSIILLRQGFLTNVFNPKVALFFLSFLPQFADTHSPYFSFQILILGSWFIFSGTIVNIAIALFFGKMKSWLVSVPLFWKWQQRITSFILISLGFKIALEKNR
jgi:threonine/homoserine/homoserine lactone efflux protein